MQSSWTKRAVEIDSLQPMSPDQLADLPDSTCAQVIHHNSEICNKWLPTANKRNGKKQKEINGILFTTKFTVNKVNLFTLQYYSPNSSYFYR
jgi:hypothetical protein